MYKNITIVAIQSVFSFLMILFLSISSLDCLTDTNMPKMDYFQLANIIWGDAGETDDHIVPYPDASEDLRNKKEWNQEAAAVKLTDQKRPEDKIDIHGRKLESSSNLENDRGLSASGFCTNSWPELSLSNAVEADQGSLGTEVSKNLTEISKHFSSRGGKIANRWN